MIRRILLIGLLSLSTSGVWADEALPDLLLSFRASSGASLPERTAELDRSAQKRALHLAEAGALSHEDGKGRGPGLQMVSEGFPPGVFGEILAAGASVDTVWQGWLSSPPHRAILAEPGWTQWGWGVVETGSTRVWVVRFWKP